MTLSRSLSVLAVASFLAAALVARTRPAVAAPVPFTGELPLTNSDVSALRARLTTDEFIRTLDFLGALRVFEDDASTPARPVYYLAPFFTADTSQEVIGGQEIATDILTYLDQLDALLATIQGSHRTLDRLETLRADYLSLADRLSSKRAELPVEAARRLVDYATKGNPYQIELGAFPGRIDAAMSKLPITTRTDIAAELLRLLDKLKVKLTASERDLARKDPIKFVITMLPKLRAHLASLLLGIRYATFVSGMTADQMHLLANYRQVRPDVVISALPIRLLRVVPISSVADPIGTPDGVFVSGPQMIRGVNSSTGGVCGVLASCTVIVEYTEMGARSALLSMRGASIMPAQFLGDVVVKPGPLDPPVVCDIALLRRLLTLPFGVGLLGDREILRLLPGRICRTTNGDATKLAATLVLSDTFRNLFFDGAQLSVARRHQLTAEITQLISDDATAIDRLGSVGTVMRFLDPASYLTRFTRSYYIRQAARFPDALIEGLLISSGPSPATARFDFDGIAIACWKDGADKTPYLSACPDNPPEEPDTQGASAGILEARECGKAADLPACVTRIHDARRPDDRGYLWIDR